MTSRRLGGVGWSIAMPANRTSANRAILDDLALEAAMTADELWALVLAAKREIEQATEAQKATPPDASLAESGELRDRVASATLELMRLERLWRRHSRNSRLGDL